MLHFGRAQITSQFIFRENSITRQSYHHIISTEGQMFKETDIFPFLFSFSFLTVLSISSFISLHQVAAELRAVLHARHTAYGAHTSVLLTWTCKPNRSWFNESATEGCPSPQCTWSPCWALAWRFPWQVSVLRPPPVSLLSPGSISSNISCHTLLLV